MRLSEAHPPTTCTSLIFIYNGLSQSAELACTLMVSISSCIESLSSREVQAAEDMYTATPSVGILADAVIEVPEALSIPAKQERGPLVLVNAGGDGYKQLVLLSQALLLCEEGKAPSPFWRMTHRLMRPIAVRESSQQ